jgi:SAM-dependent MidA family methyltransferase
VAYRIYETSPSLRDRQRTLLGRDAAVAAGDARRPGETLARDFPDGVKGLVLTNEVPDAFGVHKLFLTPDGDARAVLVVPRAGPALGDAVGAPLGQRIADTDRRIRQAFALDPNVQNAGDHYLDAETYAAVMTALAGHDEAARDALLAALWFEETTVPAAEIPALAAHLAANAAEYATALAAEGAGVVLYVNVHADRFIRELGSSLASGFIVTIDYGDTTWGLVQGARRCEFPFRVYGDQQDFVPRPNDPYALPGTQDLTADVDFTALAQAGRGSGLEVVHFGPERDVTGADLPALALAAAGDEALGEFLGNPVFKLLVLGKRASDAFTGPLAPSLPLWARVEDVPRSRRARIAPVRDRLTLLSNSASDPPSMS